MNEDANVVGGDAVAGYDKPIGKVERRKKPIDTKPIAESASKIDSYEKWLEEKLNVPNADKAAIEQKMRHTMPQLNNFDAFKKDLSDSKIDMTTAKKNASKLVPTQSNFNEDKVNRLKNSGWDSNPIIVSNDDHVIDGHHRWLAACELNKEIECRVVDLSAEELLKFVDGKPYVENKKLNESVGG